MQDPFADLHTIIKNPRRTGGVKKVDDNSVQPQTTIVPQPTVVVQPSTIEPSIPTTSVTQITTSSTTNTPTKKKYTDDYDPFSNISALAGIKKTTKEPTPVPPPAPAMLSLQKQLNNVTVPESIPVNSNNDYNNSNVILQPALPQVVEPKLEDFDNFKKSEVKEVMPLPIQVANIEPIVQPKIEPTLKFEEIYQKQEDQSVIDADFIAFNNNTNSNNIQTNSIVPSTVDDNFTAFNNNSNIGQSTNAAPTIVVVEDDLFLSFSEPTVKTTTTSEETGDEYDELLDVFSKPASSPAPAPAPAPAPVPTVNKVSTTTNDVEDNYDPFETNTNKKDPFKNQKNTNQKQQGRQRQEVSSQQKPVEDEYDHIEYESDEEENDYDMGSNSFGRIKGQPNQENKDLDNLVREGPILGRVSTRTLFAQKDWADLYWTLENDVLILYRSRTDYEYNKSRAEVKKRIPIQHTHRVLKIKSKDYKGYGALHNFMLEEVLDYGPANIAKFGSTDRRNVEQLHNIIKSTVLKIRRSLQQPQHRGDEY